MKTHVEFTSYKFPPYEGEEHEINPGCWGKRLVEYLGPILNSKGIKTEPFIAEDWGWVLPIRNSAFPMWIGASHQDGPDNRFLCFIDPDKSPVWRWIKRIDTTEQVGRVADALNDILTADSDIKDVKWWTKKDYQSANQALEETS